MNVAVVGVRAALIERVAERSFFRHVLAIEVASAFVSGYGVRRIVGVHPHDGAASLHVKDDVLKEKGIQHMIIKRGTRLDFGDGAYADVLFPNTDQSTQAVTNDGSIVLHVVYGKTSFMLTADLPSPYEDRLVALDGNSLHSDVLKAGHHGSRYSTDSLWLSSVSPEYVVISAGKGNSYGHPHKEVLERVEKQGAQIASTIDFGTITFESDGVSVSRK